MGANFFKEGFRHSRYCCKPKKNGSKLLQGELQTQSELLRAKQMGANFFKESFRHSRYCCEPNKWEQTSSRRASDRVGTVASQTNGSKLFKESFRHSRYCCKPKKNGNKLLQGGLLTQPILSCADTETQEQASCPVFWHFFIPFASGAAIPKPVGFFLQLCRCCCFVGFITGCYISHRAGTC